MACDDNQVNPSLVRLAEQWLRRPLVPDECQQLAVFQRGLGDHHEQAIADMAAHAAALLHAQDNVLLAVPPVSQAVSAQVTDAVTSSNVKVVAEAPAMAMGTIYQTMAHSTGIMFENAVASQQQQNSLGQAAANQGVMQIYSLDTKAAAGATEKVAQSGAADNLASLLTVLNAFKA